MAETPPFRAPRLCAHCAGACHYCLDDVVVARAAADVAFEPVPHLFLGRLPVAHAQLDRTHDHARRAEAALEPLVLAKRLLHRMQLVAFGEPLDGGDVLTFGLDRQHSAGLGRTAVYMHDAGAALTRVAADMGTGEPEILSQELHEQCPWLDVGRDAFPVHRHRNSRHEPLPRLAARRPSTPAI